MSMTSRSLGEARLEAGGDSCIVAILFVEDSPHSSLPRCAIALYNRHSDFWKKLWYELGALVGDIEIVLYIYIYTEKSAFCIRIHVAHLRYFIRLYKSITSLSFTQNMF